MPESSHREGSPHSIGLTELVLAFENHDTEISYFVDRATGQVVAFGPEAQSELDEVYEAMGEAADPAALDAALQGRQLADWLEDEVRCAAQVGAGIGTRFVRVPNEEPSDAYDDLAAFVESVTDRRLRGRLERAITGRGAFRRFKDELLDHPAERERWFGFRQARLHQRILDWLRSEGIAAP